MGGDDEPTKAEKITFDELLAFDESQKDADNSHIMFYAQK